jgi:hypothetical protein
MITLKNPRLPDLEPIEVEALADTGSLHLSIPEHIRLQLRLEEPLASVGEGNLFSVMG